MRTDEITRPIAPADTERYERWPQHNDLDAALPMVDSVRPATVLAPRSPAPAAPPTTAPPLPPLLVPLDFGEPAYPYPFENDVAARRNVGNPRDGYPSVRSRRRGVHGAGRRRVAPLARTAMRTGMASLPLILLFGLGGVIGVLAVVLGTAGVWQARRHPEYRGTGRAVGAIILGTAAAVVGLPVLLLLLLGVAGGIALL